MSKKAKADFPDMKKPIPFITDVKNNRKWEINQEAENILRNIVNPVSVIAVVGKYRTGKSYLMNKLAGEYSGFSLGSKVQAETKGIWMWVKPHPKDPNTSLILLDTEGLYDVKLNDKTRDMQLFTFAVLLSDCLAFNSVGSIDANMIDELNLVSTLTDRIQIKKDTIEEGDFFMSYFPRLFVVVRDFCLELEIDGKKVTADEYLEDSLRLKRGTEKEDEEYNKPRDCIIRFFKERHCFVLPKPVEKDKELAKLDQKGAKVTKEFVKKADEAIKALFTAAKPKCIQGSKVTAPGFLRLVREFVCSVNEGGVPCIESALDVMKDTESQAAMKTALDKYQKNMDEVLTGKMPLENEELENVHNKCLEEATNMYTRLCHTDKQHLQEVQGEIEEQLSQFMIQNISESEKASKKAISKCFEKLEQGLANNVYAATGGHAKYVSVKDKAVEAYKKAKKLGPTADRVLTEYLKNKQDAETAIIAADEALSEKEQQEARWKEENKLQEQEKELERAEKEEIQRQMQRQSDESAIAIQKMENEKAEVYARLRKENEETVKAKEKAMKDMLEQGLAQEAKKYNAVIERMKKDISKQEQEEEKKMEMLRQNQMLMKQIQDLVRSREVSREEIERMKQQRLKEVGAENAIIEQNRRAPNEQFLTKGLPVVS